MGEARAAEATPPLTPPAPQRPAHAARTPPPDRL